MVRSSRCGKPRIVIADDNEATRYLFRLLAEVECEVIAEVESGYEAISAVEALSPDVLVMDISMPGITGFQAARVLRERMPDVGIILVSQHADPAYAEEALRLGIRGYVVKSAAGIELLPAIHKVFAGTTFRSSRASSISLA